MLYRQHAVDHPGLVAQEKVGPLLGMWVVHLANAGADRCAVLPARVGVAAAKTAQAAPVKTIRRYVAVQIFWSTALVFGALLLLFGFFDFIPGTGRSRQG